MNKFQKILLAVGCLLGVSNMGLAQSKFGSQGAELSISYLRGTQKLHDLQASPMIYFTDYNGVNLDYKRLKGPNRWEFGLKAKTGSMIAPSLGEREFQFEEGGDGFFLVPTQYFGEVRASYQRLLTVKSSQVSYLGFSLRDQIHYADGLAMNTWAMNQLTLAVRYTHSLKLGERHQLSGDFQLPVLALISRMPYSNVVSQPDKSQGFAFLENSKFTSAHELQHPEFQVAYRYRLANRSSLSLSYNYDWMRYSKPQTIKKSTHELALSYVFLFQFSPVN